MKLAEAYVDVIANTGTLGAGLEHARSLIGGALGGLGSLISGVAGTLFAPLSAAFGALTSLPGLIGLGAGFGGIIAGVLHATNAASDLNEQLSKAGFVFGDSANVVIKTADEMARKFGINKATFVDSATSIGLIGKASGLTQAAAAKMGAQFGVLAADMASFYNVPVENALLAIRSGLVGESQPLRTFGVLLSEVAVKAEAYRMGLAKVGTELNEQQKVQARASLIMAQTKDAHGDLERTQDSFANRSRQVGGQLENLAASIGLFFLPAMGRITELFSTVIGDIDTYITDNKSSFQSWADYVADLVGYLEVAWKNFPLVLDVAQEYVREKLTNIREIFDWLVTNTGPAFARLGETITDRLREMFTAALEMATRFGTKLGMILANPIAAGALVGQDIGAMLGGKMNFGKTDFTPLELTKSPELAAALAKVESVKAEMDTARKAQNQERAMAQAVAEQQKLAAGVGEGGPGTGGPIKKAKEKAPEILSLTSMGDAIIKAALGQKDIPAQQLKEQKKGNEILKDLKDKVLGDFGKPVTVNFA